MPLAQINIARMKAPIDSPIMADFVANLDRINALAENHEGFVWRLKDDNENATSIKVFEDDMLIINMSVWKDKASLMDYVYKTAHAEIFKRREEWFDKLGDMHMALWEVADGHFPSPEEGRERLEYLQKNGDSDFAFGFKWKK